ncbi:MAG: hypothetical protein QW101_06170 [Ignisphaera sp.]|uniref:DUF308 domain-containing protein n=1 Tax=Ignisphaera aggregans TaxID=334771 RepID=A0A7J3MYJ9_9CREN
MSIIVSRFSIIFSSILLILLGVDIIAIYYGFISLPLLIALNFIALGLLIIFRGSREQVAEERKFYFLWGFIMFVISISISLGSLMGLVIGVATFFIGLGIAILYIVSGSSLQILQP